MPPEKKMVGYIAGTILGKNVIVIYFSISREGPWTESSSKVLFGCTCISTMDFPNGKRLLVY